MNVKRMLPQFVAVVAGITVASGSCAAVRAANTAPAIVAFDRAFADTNDYTCVLHVHEAKGTATQDRVYQYQFMKPHFAKTLILDGDGKGSGGVWAGTDQVSGHQGGFLSGFHMKVSINDPRAVSLRGVTIPDGLLQRIVEKYGTTPGKLSQADGGKIGGVDDFENAAEMPVFLRLFNPNAKFFGGNAAARYAIPPDNRGGSYRRESASDFIAIGPGIGERADEHVAGNPGKRVEVAENHCNSV